MTVAASERRSYIYLVCCSPPLARDIKYKRKFPLPGFRSAYYCSSLGVGHGGALDYWTGLLDWLGQYMQTCLATYLPRAYCGDHGW